MNHNYSLFSTQSLTAGFRLECVEILNWGVFHENIFTIQPKGYTSLLTGANGAGKTTYLEALLTLLVPERRMRRYNQASGTLNPKDERTEESYVLGEIGQIENEQIRETQYLRPDKTKTFSIILAAFRNEERYITLTQIRWFVGAEMKRSFAIAHKKLSIKDDFLPLDPGILWKKRLKQKYPQYGSRELIEFFDSPGKYAESMRRFFGMRSEKALTLFSQTVGLKVLGNLDEFIRKNMLEETKIEDEFISLKEGFHSLVKAHNQILKAEAQLNLLKPIVEKQKDIIHLEEKQKEYDKLKDTAPVYFASHKQDLLATKIEEQNRETEIFKQKIEDIESQITQKGDERIELTLNIERDEVGSRIKEIEKNIESYKKEKGNRESKLSKYNKLAAKIGYEEDPNENEFYDHLEKIKLRKQSLEKEHTDSQRQYILAGEEIKKLKTDYDEKTNELQTLRNQRNNIVGRTAEIRQEILLAVGATETEIPFIGELLQVKNSAKNQWEFALEKILHHFGLQILVPEEYYQKVNQYVNENNLKGRIIYQRIKKDENFLTTFIPDVPHSLFSKIEINRQFIYANWIENQIRSNFDYICTDDLETFKTSKRALTSSGLIKNDRRHEKDDRPETFKRERFVLGWDNKDKIKLIQKMLSEIDIQIKETEKQEKEFERKSKRLKEEGDNIILFENFDKYKEIYWQEMTVEIHKAEEERDSLIKTNDKVQALKGQLNNLIDELNQLNLQKDNFKNTLLRTNLSLEENRKQQKACSDFLQTFQDMNFSEHFHFLESQYAQVQQINLSNIDITQSDVTKQIAEELTNLTNTIARQQRLLQECLSKFKYPNEELRDAFPDWESDTDKLTTQIEYVSDYIDLHDHIEKEQLFKYKEQFKKYLNNDMIERMTKFQTQLDFQEGEIRDNIESLNESLEKINFRPNPETYIFLDIKNEHSEKIRQFRLRLKDWKPNMAEYFASQDDRILETSFLKIKSLIEYLSANETERRYLTDVRNWLNFSAKELRREDKSVYRSYDSTGKLSGGEKAQLTYTILGSAIAYQFGISQSGRNTDSFRFICIDESFSNQDAEKANYLMELCKQLHLQLLCVTPDTQTSIIEPYISAVHFVKRENNRNAVIYDLPIVQFQSERSKYLSSQS